MSGFVKGILTGGIIGAIVGACLVSNREPEPRGATKMIKAKVNELMRR